MTQRSVVVIGAGIIGLELARNLLKQGADTTVIQSTDPNEEIGWASVAWTNASSKVRRSYPSHYVALNARGVDAGIRLAADIGGGWLHRTGAIEIVAGQDVPKFQADVDRLKDEFAYPAEILTAQRFAQVAPNVKLFAGETAAYFSRDAVVDVPALLTTLAASVGEAGGRLRHDRVIGFDRGGESIHSVHLESGAKLSADVVVFAAGAWTRDVARLADIVVPTLSRADQSVPGLVVTVTCPAGVIGRMLLAPEIIVRPRSDQQALLGTESALATQSSTRADLFAAAEAGLRQAQRRIPRLSRSAILDARLGMRAIPEDGLTIAGVPAETANAYVLITHSGFTLSPLLGELAASEISRGILEPELGPYRLQRFENETPA
jgi:glycine/D-amino acid oxidase-like deaminating enzyme